MQKLRLSKTVPILLACICILAFGLLIPALGYYQDDWHPIYYGFRRGLNSLWELFVFDNRPFASIIFMLGFRLWGFQPISWHIYSFVMRTLTVVFIWLAFKEIWPTRQREAAWTAILFAVYPLFKLQPLALIYSIHWTGFFFYSISIWFMLLAVRRKQKYVFLFTCLSLITSALHLVIIEYFVGLELIRPVLLWIIFSENEKNWKANLKQAVKYWLPYLVLILFYIIFRLFLIPRPPSGAERNALWLLYRFLEAPVNTAGYTLESVLMDLVTIIGAPLRELVNPDLYRFTQPASIAAVLLAAGAAIGLFFYFTKITVNENGGQPPLNQKQWQKQAVALGFFLVLLGPIPGWITDQFISLKNPLWSDRFGMASMVGASLLTVALIEILISNQKTQIILLSAITGLSIAWHFSNTNQFRWAWNDQKNFYTQLRWRAPYIQAGTTIFSDNELFEFMGEYPTQFALNTLYPKENPGRDLNYWYYSLYRNFNENRADLIDGIELRDSQYSSRFQGNSLDSLVINYKPDSGHCLWVIRPEDADFDNLPEITREVGVISNLDRIITTSPLESPKPVEIFGNEQMDTWCYYYQQADLARQLKDWEQIAELWTTTVDKGIKPGDGFELLPFIEGLGRSGDWEKAEKLSKLAHSKTRRLNPLLCSIWGRIKESSEATVEQEQVLERINSKFNCE
jgi:hypothetical protein